MMEKTKILMVLGNLRMGGAQAFILNLLQNMDMSRFQVDFAINVEGEGGGISDQICAMGCDIYFLPYFKVYNYFQFVQAWKKFFTEHHYDVVHGHSTNSASIYLKIAKDLGCATIAHSHSDGYRGGWLQRIMKRHYAKGVGRVADYWFACSDSAAQRLFSDAYKDYPNYYEIPNAINAEKFIYDDGIAKRIRKEIGVADDEWLCGHVGTFSPPKNHSFLIEVFAEVLKINPKAKLVCCGAGALMPEVKEKARGLGILNRIIFPGVVLNANEYMMAMDTLVFPSIFEGFGMAILEAEACGLPVVMSDVIPKVVDMTDLTHRCSLDDSAEKWAKIICGIKKVDRPSYNSIIADSKYNMRTSARLIMSKYEELYNSGK